jgi:hypothetical protein
VRQYNNWTDVAISHEPERKRRVTEVDPGWIACTNNSSGSTRSFVAYPQKSWRLKLDKLEYQCSWLKMQTTQPTD